MASASVPERVYYCHNCQSRTAPEFQDSTPTCPRCNLGFVEELQNANAVDPLANSIMEILQHALQRNNFPLDIASSNDMPVSANTRSAQFASMRLNHIFQILAAADLNGLNGPAPALASDISRLPKTKLTPSDLSEYDSCPICFDNYNVNDEVISLPCGHAFHSACLTKWLSEHGTCPICRKDLNGRDTSRDSQDANSGSEPQGNIPGWMPFLFGN